nr:ribosome-associated translation inhibitor RaiA [uncultured Solibaculum sp.]
MTITITGRKVTLKDSFKQRVEKKLSKMDRLFGPDAQATVTVTLEKNRQTVEVTIKQKGMTYRAEETAFEMEEAFDKVVDILTRQIRRNKTRLEKRLRIGSIDDIVVGAQEPVEEETDFKVVRTKYLPIKPISVEEAILQMNMLGHEFFMFRNADTSEINVVYRRKNGDYGLLAPGEDE